MPELPEAETIARGLHAAIAGHQVERVRVHRVEVVRPQTRTLFRRALEGRRVQAVGRRGKWLQACLDDGGVWVTQLRMTGRFSWSPPTALSRQPHLSVSIAFGGRRAGVLRFFDVRRFGRMWVLDPSAWSEIDQRLGFEPLSRRFTPASLAALLANSKAPVRNVLLDQARIAGIGNIYANEACYLARIDPRRAAAGLGKNEIRRLHGAIRRVLGRAVERKGTSLSDYRDLLGAEGSYQNELDVYGRAGEACRRCGGRIARRVLAGRSLFFCSKCQA